MFNRLIRQWVYGGTLAGVLLLFLFPLLTRAWSVPLALTFLHLPMYRLHQYEEHDNDRFRLFFNRTIGGGKEILSPLAVFVINVPGVWGIIALATCLASYVSIGLGLIAVYLAVVNGLAHIGHAVLFKSGLATAIILFQSVHTLSGRFSSQVGGSLACTQSGLGIAFGIHVAIVAYARAKGAFRNVGRSDNAMPKNG